MMKNTNTKIAKSVGFNIEGGGNVLDDRQGIDGEFQEFFDEGDEVSFEDGLAEMKDYVLDVKGEVDGEMVEGYWKEIEMMLLELKDEVGDEGVWKLWGVEYDLSLGVEMEGK